MSELVSYMFISLDGFIADAGGGLEWTPIDDELMGYANEVFADVDGIVFGLDVVVAGLRRVGADPRQAHRRDGNRREKGGKLHGKLLA